MGGEHPPGILLDCCLVDQDQAFDQISDHKINHYRLTDQHANPYFDSYGHFDTNSNLYLY